MVAIAPGGEVSTLCQVGHSENAASQAVQRGDQRRWRVQVRLTLKLANRLDGVDVSRCLVGDVLDVSDTEAAALIAEGWAQPVVESPSILTSQTKLPLIS